MNKLFTGIAGLSVLLLHTAAQAQQVAPQPQEYPPAYAPPPGYVPPPPPPPSYGAPSYGPPPSYGAAPVYVPPPPYRYAPAYRYAPPSYYALPPPPPPRDVLYRPLTLGFGIGFGGLIFDDSTGHTHQGGFAYTGRIGFGLRPGLILLLDTEGAVVGDGATTISQSANVIGLQIFVTRRLFVKGGFGFGAASQDNAPTMWGPAAMGGAGYELAQGWNWSFDIEATISGARYHDNGLDQNWTNWSLVNFALNFF